MLCNNCLKDLAQRTPTYAFLHTENAVFRLLTDTCRDPPSKHTPRATLDSRIMDCMFSCGRPPNGGLGSSLAASRLVLVSGGVSCPVAVHPPGGCTLAGTRLQAGLDNCAGTCSGPEGAGTGTA
jgi:hypothetical protein